jgi:hypothetical protein
MATICVRSARWPTSLASKRPRVCLRGGLTFLLGRNAVIPIALILLAAGPVPAQCRRGGHRRGACIKYIADRDAGHETSPIIWSGGRDWPHHPVTRSTVTRSANAWSPVARIANAWPSGAACAMDWPMRRMMNGAPDAPSPMTRPVRAMAPSAVMMTATPAPTRPAPPCLGRACKLKGCCKAYSENGGQVRRTQRQQHEHPGRRGEGAAINNARRPQASSPAQ